MIRLGAIFRCNQPPRHIWVVLSDSTKTDGKVLLVNFTTLTERCIDDICVLGPDDYALLEHPTTVAYSRRQAGNLTGFEQLVNNGTFRELPPLPDCTLQKIIAGAHRSDQLSVADKALLPLPPEPK